MAGYNNYTANPNPYQFGVTPVQYQNPPQPRPYYNYDTIYVTGIEGANAFQLPPGVTHVVLWDTDVDSFYIKKLDEMGRPKVVAWKDYVDHVEPKKPESVEPSNIDFSVYPTKKDIEAMLSKFDTSKYLTKEDLEKVIGELFVGERGKVVRHNELNT